jgi:two-component system response regulator MtrA
MHETIRDVTDRPKRILVADDEPDVRELVVYRMKRSGYDVIEAKNGEEAFELAVAELPDLIVSDVMMPRVDGYELTRRLRAEPTTQRIPIILLTAKTQEADVSQGFDAGADDYLKKPFNPDELVARVRAVLGRR